MRFRRALRSFIDNFNCVYKLLLYRTITGIIFFSLLYVTLTLGLNHIIHSGETECLITLSGEFFNALVTGNTAYLEGFQSTFMEALGDFGQLLLNNIGSIVGSGIGAVVLYLASRIANGLAVYTLGGLVHERMTLYARGRFSSAFFSGFVPALVYTVVYIPLAFLYDVLAVVFTWFFFFYALSFLPLIVTFMLAVTAMVCLEALKFTFISAWMPAMLVDKKGLGAAMRGSFGAFSGFGRRFSNYLVSIYLIMVVNIVFGLFTLGSALLLTVPMTFVYLLCVQLVIYYEDNNKKYFVSYDKISGTTEGGNLPE